MKNIKGIYLGYAENLEPQSRAFEEVGGELIKGSLGVKSHQQIVQKVFYLQKMDQMTR